MSTRAGRLGKNTFFVFVGNFGGKVIGLLMLPFYTRWLSVEDYGITDAITVYAALLVGIVTCCIGDSLFIFPKDAPPVEQRRYYSSGMVFLAAMVGLWALLSACAACLFSSTGASNSFAGHVWLIYFMLVSQAFQQVSQQFTRSIGRMKVYGITGAVCTAATAGYAFLLIPGHGVVGYVWSIVLANVTAGLYSFFFSGSYRYFGLRCVCRLYVVRMLRYSVPLIPNTLMWWVVGAMNRPLMEHYLGFHDMGVFAVANKIPGILNMAFSVFAISWQISVLEEFGKEGYTRFYNTVFRSVYVLLVAVLLAITLASRLMVSVFADAAYGEAWRYVPLLTLGALFSSISGFAGSNFSATRESKYFFYSSLWGGLSAAILNFILIPAFGLYGVCASLVLSFFIMAVSRIMYGWKHVRIERPTRHLATTGLACLIAVSYVMEVGAGVTYLLVLILVVFLLLSNRDLLALARTKLKKLV